LITSNPCGRKSLNEGIRGTNTVYPTWWRMSHEAQARIYDTPAVASECQGKHARLPIEQQTVTTTLETFPEITHQVRNIIKFIKRKNGLYHLLDFLTGQHVCCISLKLCI